MNELLKKLLAADILTEDTKAELESAFAKQLTETIDEARANATALVTAKLNEQWIEERETLIEALDAKVTEALTDELNELREDIERFRDLETEYATKLVETKSNMARVLKKDMGQLVEKMDTFFEVRLATELNELREDFEVVKKNEFGRNVFEAFVKEFKQHYAGDNSTEAALTEAEYRLEDALSALEESERKTARLERSMKMEKVLQPLSGRTKEVMEAILKNVDTSLLEDAYQVYVGRVLKESDESTASGKEHKVLAEGNKTKKVTGTVRNGNNQEQMITEAAIDHKDRQSVSSISDAEKAQLRKIAGIE